MHFDFGEDGGAFALMQDVKEEGFGVIVPVVAEGDARGSLIFGFFKNNFTPCSGAAVAFQFIQLQIHIFNN